MDGKSKIRSRLWPGQLVSITFDDKLLAEVEFSTAGHHRTHHVFFERIRLDSWPSSNDYFGADIRVQEGDVANDSWIPVLAGMPSINLNHYGTDPLLDDIGPVG